MIVAPGSGADLGVYSCSIKTDPIPNADYFFDVSLFRDPQSNRGYRHTYSDGRAGACQDYVREDSRVAASIDLIKLLAHLHFRSVAPHGGWMSFAFRDHHGIWIAPSVAEIVAEALSKEGYRVSLHHFELKGK